MFELSIDSKQLNMEKLLDTGQVFRYIHLDTGSFILIYGQDYVLVDQVEDGYRFHCQEEDMGIWQDYLNLHMDYILLNKEVVKKEKRLSQAVKSFEGIRIMHQDPFEMLVTFIISQSKSMVQIRKLVNELSKAYGNPLGEWMGHRLYAFPRPEQLMDLSEADFRSMKFGYRAPYLVDAVKVFYDKGHELNELSTTDLMEQLLKIKGVGRKVASCVILFGYNRYDVFPVDVWMRRIMIDLYDKRIRKRLKNPNIKKLSDKHIEDFGLAFFGQIAGIAQQYLFEYGRSSLK